LGLQLGLPLLVHGEVVDPGVDIFDREREFLDQKLVWPIQITKLCTDVA
jgi:dihydroorotase